MPDLPRWKFGDILERRSNVGRDRVKVMFIRFDRERRKMLGGGAVQFVGVRLDNNDRTNPKFVAVGRIDNYSLPGFQLVEDDPRVALYLNGRRIPDMDLSGIELANGDSVTITTSMTIE